MSKSRDETKSKSRDGTKSKSKGRQKTKMVKMEKESNLQVTFSKRKNGLFKKASELCTLCAAHMAVIVFSPSGKVYCFGHQDIETIINHFENNDHPPLNAQPNTDIQNLNNLLTQRMDEQDLLSKKSEEMKKQRKESKTPETWLKEYIRGIDLVQASEFKGKIANLKKQVSDEAMKSLQIPIHHPGFYEGSSANAHFGVGVGVNINPNLSMFDQTRMMDMNNFYNHNMALPDYRLSFGNYSNAEGFVPRYGYILQPNPNGHQNPSSTEENEAGNEHHYDGHPPQPRSD
ncbi:unnamed protein product [Eruca vesicaria subsp. sativa]|uniref:MADS-box domain-containing protein n=1 Tax=Eruca vesicaria subsp. sativa TaxID=29727 RepID=A0ABC8KYS3_ERUVS|nr:unnamed protein product [Eruca vesicaria subsp. sativa]